MTEYKQQKNYAAGFYIKEKIFGDKSSLLNVSIKMDTFLEWLGKLQLSDQGYVNLTIGKRMKPTPKGQTHTAWENTWRPDNHRTSTAPDEEPVNREHVYASNDLPF